MLISVNYSHLFLFTLETAKEPILISETNCYLANYMIRTYICKILLDLKYNVPTILLYIPTGILLKRNVCVAIHIQLYCH